MQVIPKMKKVKTLDDGKGEHCTIMVVDDDEDMRALLVETLQENGCRVLESCDGNGALAALQTITPKIIVTELKMPYGGYVYLRSLKAAAPQSPIVVVTAHGDSQSQAKVLDCGAQGYFEKPLHLNELDEWIARMCLVNPCGNTL